LWQLSELQEAADAAEESMSCNAEEMQRQQSDLKSKIARITDLEKSLASLQAEIEVKDKRIVKLEGVRLTQDFLQRVQKIKNERSQLAAEVNREPA